MKQHNVKESCNSSLIKFRKSPLLVLLTEAPLENVKVEESKGEFKQAPTNSIWLQPLLSGSLPLLACAFPAQMKTHPSTSAESFSRKSQGHRKIREAGSHMQHIPDWADYAEKFRDQKTDGWAAFLMTVNYLIRFVNIKSAHFLNVCEGINKL